MEAMWRLLTQRIVPFLLTLFFFSPGLSAQTTTLRFALDPVEETLFWCEKLIKKYS
jgi:hypothetical protein